MGARGKVCGGRHGPIAAGLVAGRRPTAEGAESDGRGQRPLRHSRSHPGESSGEEEEELVGEGASSSSTGASSSAGHGERQSWRSGGGAWPRRERRQRGPRLVRAVASGGVAARWWRFGRAERGSEARQRRFGKGVEQGKRRAPAAGLVKRRRSAARLRRRRQEHHAPMRA